MLCSKLGTTLNILLSLAANLSRYVLNFLVVWEGRKYFLQKQGRWKRRKATVADMRINTCIHNCLDILQRNRNENRELSADGSV